MWQDFLHSERFFHGLVGAATGLLRSAAQDRETFKTWRKIDDALRFNWRVALPRYAKGAVQGFLIGAGLDWVVASPLWAALGALL